MSSQDFDIDSFLSDGPDSSDDAFGDWLDGTIEDDGNVIGADYVPWTEVGYEGSIDYRIRQLSYSSILALHACPRKFELYKKRTTHRTLETEQQTVTFAFGHVVGEAIASVFEGKSEQEILWKLFLGWHAPYEAVDTKSRKSIHFAVIAVQKMISLREAGFLEEYELVWYQGRPATELSFCVNFPDGFRLRGFVDAVLRHKETGEIIVLECKTTNAAALNPATYKNSAQAIGYSIVLDVIFPELSSYSVLYLVYQTKAMEFTPIPFQKTYLQRALWIRELLLDIETIKMYDEAGVYPMRGESCFSFGRECEYYQSCTLSTRYLTRPCTEKEEDKTEYQINLSLVDLLDAQLKKTDLENTEEVMT